MKKILLIVAIAMLSSCNEQEKRRITRKDEAIRVEDNYGVVYRIITIEGCEFYYGLSNGESLTKVDCNCVPDKSGRTF